MLRQCVVAVFRSLNDATMAVRALENRGLFDQVSLVTRDIDTEVPKDQREPISHGDDSLQSGAQGATAGGLLGFLLTAPLLAIPGVGLVLIAGPIAAGMTGAIVGGFLGAMGGWGVKSERLDEYQKIVHGGSPLVVVSGEPEEVSLAKQVLEQLPALSVHLHATTADTREATVD